MSETTMKVGDRFLLLVDAGNGNVAPAEAQVHEVSPSGKYARLSNGRCGYGWYEVANYAETSRVVERLDAAGGV